MLQSADVYQNDWNQDNIRCLRVSETTYMPVLIDFAFAVQIETGYDMPQSSTLGAWETLRSVDGIPEEALAQILMVDD